MDRTRRLRQAREEAKKKARLQRVAEEEASQLDQYVADAREKLEATKAAKLRAAESRRILTELQNEMEEGHTDVESDHEVEGDGATQMVSKTELSSLVADSIKSVVSIHSYLD